MMKGFIFLLVGLFLLSTLVLDAQDKDCNDFSSLFEAGEYEEVIELLLECKKDETLNEETRKRIDFYLHLSHGSLGDYANLDAAALENLIRDDALKNDGNIILAYITLSNFHTENQNYNKAIELNEELLFLAKQYISIESINYATVLNILATSHYNAKNYTEALELIQLALSIQKRQLGENHPEYTASLSRLANLYSIIGDYTNAIELVQQILSIQQRQIGKNHSDYALTLNSLANIFFTSGNYSKAIELGQQALNIQKQVLGEEHPDYATSLSNLALYYSSLGNYSKAIELGQKAINIQEQVLDKNHPNYATSLSNLSACLTHIGDYPKAIELEQQALDIRKQILGENHPDYALSLNNLGQLYSKSDNYPKSIEIAQEALNIQKQALGENHPSYAMSLSNLAGYYSSLGDFGKAIELAQQALDIRKQILGENHPHYATSLSNLASYYSSSGDYSKAIEMGQQALNIQKQVLGENHFNHTITLSNLALHYSSSGDYNKAIELGQQALNILKQVLGENHPDYATPLNNLAVNYAALGNYSKAIELAEEVLRIRKQVLGEEHSLYAASLGNLGNYYSSLGDFSRAMELYQQASDIIKAIFGENHPDYALSLNNLASLYSSFGDYKKAIEIGQQALDIQKRILGSSHPNYALSLSNLATYYSDLEDYNKAIKLEQESLEIRKQVFGGNHPDYATSLNNLAFNYFDTNDFSQSSKYLHKVIYLKQEQLQFQFTWLTEYERDLYWKQEKSLFIYLPSFGYSSNNYPLFLNSIYNSTLLSKGLMLNASTELNSLLAESGNKEVINKAERLRTAHNVLNRLYEKPISERYLNTDSLEAEAQQLERELLSISKEYGDYTRFMSVTWQDVQEQLGKNNVAIEFVEFPVLESDSIMYAALVLREGWKQPRMIPLFEKKEIEQYLAQSPDKQYSGYVAKQLYRLMWKPLKSVLSPGENIYFSAAGVYHQMAVEYLPNEEGIPLCDIYQLHRLSSTRQLALAKEAEPVKSAVLYGGIQYDVNPDEMLSESQKYQPDENLYAYRGASMDSLRGSHWVALANTVPEVDFISGELERNNIYTRTFTGSAANEESFKSLSGKRVNILHLATHGFFLPVEETRDINYFRLMGQEANPAPDFSMRRSGLIMAGGNGAWTGSSVPEGVEDGILTAQEISVLDFRGMDMVVLSACETALGDISTSEGVFGLQRAFKKAGVNTIVMSLWKVSDEVTRALMNKFYQTLLDGKTKREAFQDARAFIRERHPQPRDWAAFIMLD